jgi:hypothetical protein
MTLKKPKKIAQEAEINSNPKTLSRLNLPPHVRKSKKKIYLDETPIMKWNPLTPTSNILVVKSFSLTAFSLFTRTRQFSLSFLLTKKTEK